MTFHPRVGRLFERPPREVRQAKSMFTTPPALPFARRSIHCDPTRAEDVFMFAPPPAGDAMKGRTPDLPSSPAEQRPPSPDVDVGVAPWGFGFEFEQTLQEKWQDDLDRQEARLWRYSQFGMDAYDARQPTPEDMREKYNNLLQSELEDVHTPTPSPSASPKPISQPLMQSIDGSGDGNDNREQGPSPRKRRRKDDDTKPSKRRKSAATRIKKNQNSAATQDTQYKPTMRPINTRSQNRPSTHHMKTRSQTWATIRKGKL